MDGVWGSRGHQHLDRSTNLLQAVAIEEPTGWISVHPVMNQYSNHPFLPTIPAFAQGRWSPEESAVIPGQPGLPGFMLRSVLVPTEALGHVVSRRTHRPAVSPVPVRQLGQPSAASGHRLSAGGEQGAPRAARRAPASPVRRPAPAAGSQRQGPRAESPVRVHRCRHPRYHPALVPTAVPNAHVERLVLSIKSECLDRIVPLGEAHLRWAVSEYIQHYHAERPHQDLDGALIEGDGRPGSAGGVVRCRDRVGGMLRLYYREAA